MKLFWALVVLGLMLLPITKLKLRPAQKQSMRLRQHAIESGLRVLFAPSPSKTTAIAAKPSIRYQLEYSLDTSRDAAIAQQLWLRTSSQQWNLSPQTCDGVSQTQQTALKRLLSQLPEDVNALEICADFIGCYWFEQGDIQDVAQIAMTLKQVNALFV